MSTAINRAIVARLDWLGNLDPTFNKGIGFTLPTGLGYTQGQYLALSSEHICVGGAQTDDITGQNNFFALKLNQWNGSLYTPFGGNGLCVRPLPNPAMGISQASGMYLKEDGGVLLGGRIKSALEASRPFALICLTDHGAFDHTFGNDGVVFGKQDEFVYGLGKLSDKVVMIGVRPEVSTNAKIRLVKIDPEIHYIETAFNTTAVLTPLKMTAYGGYIYIAGHSNDHGTLGYFLARLDSAGQPDPTFGNQGLVIDKFNPSAGISALCVSERGIHLAGNVSNTSNTLILARHRLNGTPDEAFSGDGKLVVTYAYLNDMSIKALMPTSDGFIYVGGQANNKCFLAAFRPNGDKFTNFGENSFQVEPGTLLLDKFEKPEQANPSNYICQSLAASPDGKSLVMCGYSTEIRNLDADHSSAN